MEDFLVSAHSLAAIVRVAEATLADADAALREGLKSTQWATGEWLQPHPHTLLFIVVCGEGGFGRRGGRPPPPAPFFVFGGGGGGGWGGGGAPRRAGRGLWRGLRLAGWGAERSRRGLGNSG